MYQDTNLPFSIQELLNEIADLNQDNVLSFVDKYLPGWLISCNTEFSPECKVFDENWKFKLCKMFKTEPKSILLVKTMILPYDPDYQKHIILMRYCDVLTKFGYCVRPTDMFTECKHCKKIKQTRNPEKHICISTE